MTSPQPVSETAEVVNVQASPEKAQGRPSDPKSLPVLGAALALGALAVGLFYGERLGISVPVFATALVATLLALARLTDVRPRWTNGWLLAPVAFFAAMVPLRADPILTLLNLACVLLALGLLAAFFTGGRPSRQRLGTLLLAPLLTSAHALVRTSGLVADVRPPVEGDEVKARLRRLVPVLRGLLMALPLLAVFGLLLASADLVFERMMADLLTLDVRIPLALQRLFGQAAVAMVVAWLVAGAFAYALDRHETKTLLAPPATASTSASAFSLGPVEAVTVVAALDAMLLLFGWIQLHYLFGGEAALAAEGITYAAYARRGFFELVAVAVLALLLILTLARVTRFETAKQERRFETATALMIALVLVLLASAFQRLALYEAAYGYTRLRLYAHVFIVCLSAVLLWLPTVRWAQRRWAGWPLSFGFGALTAAFLFAASLNVLNPDAFIARQNAERFARTGKLDVRYLTGLSDEAVPATVDVLPQVEGRERAVLAKDLERRRERLERRQEATGWPSWHAGRARALRAIQSGLEAELHRR